MLCWGYLPLEKQFGKLRQGCGGTYFITVQQMLEKVGIAKTKLLLNSDLNIDVFSIFSIHSRDQCGYILDEGKCNILDSFPDLEKKLPSDVTMALIMLLIMQVETMMKFMIYRKILLIRPLHISPPRIHALQICNLISIPNIRPPLQGYRRSKYKPIKFIKSTKH